MRNLIKRSCVLVVAVLAAATMSAQVFTTAEGYESNKDNDGKIVRGPYLTNTWKDNWYIGLAGGAQTHFSEITKANWQPIGEIYLLKWFSPMVGARIGYQGFTGKETFSDAYVAEQASHGREPYSDYLIRGVKGHSFWDKSYNAEDKTLSYGQSYVHGDLIWNIVNTIWGYKRSRVWTISPYINAGFVMLYEQPWKWGESFFQEKNRDLELAGGVGLLNTFRITDRLTATLDIMDYNMSARYHSADGGIVSNLSVTAGLAVNVYMTYWNRSGGLQKQIENAEKAVDDAKKALADAEATKARLEETNRQLDEANRQLDEANKKLDSANTGLTDENTELKQKVNRLQARLNSVNGRVEGLPEDKYKEIQDQVALLSSRVQDLNGKVDEMSEEDAKLLEEQLNNIDDSIKGLENSVKDLSDQTISVSSDDFQRRIANADQVVYFDMNQSTLRFSENFHLDTYVKSVLNEDPDHIFYLTGSADKGTGSMARNVVLSRERAQGIKNILMNKYNVPEENIIIKATIVSDKNPNGALDRCVLLEKE